MTTYNTWNGALDVDGLNMSSGQSAIAAIQANDELIKTLADALALVNAYVAATPAFPGAYLTALNTLIGVQTTEVTRLQGLVNNLKNLISMSPQQ
jgi:hypothetical protein